MTQQNERNEYILRLFEYATEGNLMALQRQQQQQQQRQQQVFHCDDYCCFFPNYYRHPKDSGTTLLHYAAGNGHTTVCQWLLNQLLTYVESQSIDESTLSNKVYSFLLCKTTKNERTALHWASRNGHLQTIQWLVEQMKTYNNQSTSTNCNTTVSTLDVYAKGNVTPLQLCIWQGHVECSKWLINVAKANPKYENGWGCTLLHWLAKSPIYNMELNNDDDHDDDTKENEKNSHARKRLESLCEWLSHIYDQDTDTTVTTSTVWNSTNNQGQTPLHKAAYSGNVPVCQYIVKKIGIFDEVRDRQGLLAADCAERNSQWAIAQWLRRYASPILWSDAINVLGLSTTNTDHSRRQQLIIEPPTLIDIRIAYKKLIRQYHPDRFQNANRQGHEQTDDDDNINKKRTWQSIQDAYQLWTLWWTNPDVLDQIIRIKTRNTYIQNIPPLLKWYDEWHQQQQQQQQQQQHADHKSRMTTRPNVNIVKENTSIASTGSSHGIPTNFCINKSKQSNISSKAWEELQEFETKLVRMLSTIPQYRIPLSQLPKEYNKTWRQSSTTTTTTTRTTTMINHKTYHCRKLRYLLEKYCSNTIEIVDCSKETKYMKGDNDDTSTMITWVRLKLSAKALLAEQ